jgi:hypothetical protein
MIRERKWIMSRELPRKYGKMATLPPPPPFDPDPAYLGRQDHQREARRRPAGASARGLRAGIAGRGIHDEMRRLSPPALPSSPALMLCVIATMARGLRARVSGSGSKSLESIPKRAHVAAHNRCNLGYS